MKGLIEIVAGNRNSATGGIYSVCCAQPLVIEAAIEQAKLDGTGVLIEATANQVNQFGGYTGMRPADYLDFIYGIADRLGFSRDRIIPGGDHLGPVCWVDEGKVSAMEKAKELIRSYVLCGFKKIHLDTSMRCSDDPEVLDDRVVAARAAQLCDVAEKAAIEAFGYSDIVYVVGTEVPPPGGASEHIETLEVTPVERVEATIQHHKEAFAALGLEQAWDRVIAIVVQPGVEFDNTHVFDFDATGTAALSACITRHPNLVFEAHSTDYQRDSAYKKLVENHFAILKVGPQLTFAMREALFALSFIEEELIPINERAFLRDIIDQAMKDEVKYWKKFYPVKPSEEALYRRYSYSDRIRYYWNNNTVEKSVEKLISNLDAKEIPLPLLKQFMPVQYDAVRNGLISGRDPKTLIKHKIMEVTKVYSQACLSN